MSEEFFKIKTKENDAALRICVSILLPSVILLYVAITATVGRETRTISFDSDRHA